MENDTKNKTFFKESYKYLNIVNNLFDNCKFDYCDFSYTKLNNTTFNNCTFNNCKLNNTVFYDTKFKDTFFNDCEVYKVKVNDGTLFDNSNIQLAKLSQHFALYYNGILEINCMQFKYSYWEQHYKDLRVQAGLTEAQSEEYFNTIKALIKE